MSELTWTADSATLGELVPWERNPKSISKHNAERLLDYWQRIGQFQTVAIGPGGEVYDGHQRLSVLKAAFGPSYRIDVRRASRALSEAERQELVIAAHAGTVGSWDWDALASWDAGELRGWGFDAELLHEWNDDAANLALMLEAETGENCTAEKGAQPNPRNLPIDVIYTLQTADCTCCLAAQAGLKYGINSAHYRLCPYVGQLSGRHAVSFIDNEYHEYKHDVHLAAVRDIHPKYATVRDVMTKEQCAKDGIEFFELGQILDWAEELREHAENVIVIPKYDCLDKIPSYFMLGYSVPTSHGGTPLPLELFRGWRVHLLGGSWKEQLRHMAQLGDDVASLDNNHVSLIASSWGQFYTPEGETQALSDVGLGKLTNPRYAALALSFGAMGAKVNELYSAGPDNPA